MPFGTISGAGLIFGVTGGVTEAVLRRVVSNKSNSNLISISHAGQRGRDGIKEFSFPYGDTELKIAVVSGLGNAEEILNRVKAGEHFDFIEVMACPGGCVSGGGQPFAPSPEHNKRDKGMYESERQLSIRRSEENPVINTLYRDIIKGKVHELLHVDYVKDGGEKE